MPIYVLIDGGCLILGGTLGLLFARFLSKAIQQHMNLYFGCISVSTGIYLVTAQGARLGAAALALLLGGFCGELLKIHQRIERGTALLQSKIGGGASPERTDMLLTVMILDCASITGILGVLDGVISRDWTVFTTKILMDGVSAIFFAMTAGPAILAVSVPLVVIFSLLSWGAEFLMPLMDTQVLADFRACGGMMQLLVGLRLIMVKDAPVSNLLPALAAVIPISWFWTWMF